ncbi:tyrosine-type recombinase/integrase [Alloscardovia venturai]|uniref:Tyrosine-type recombinase/integrase n=1 Tax=Alloscardovia venturai TaxID=1769421 RepID=A0ABW2Y3K8_9BIFI
MEFLSHRQPPEDWIPYIDGWVGEMRFRNFSQATIQAWWYRVSAFALYINAEKKDPLSITRHDIIERMSREVSVSTKRCEFNALRSFYAYMFSNHLIPENPMDGLPTIKRVKKRQAPAQTQNVQKGLEIADEDTKLMIELAVELGLRRNEIASIYLPNDLIEDLMGYSLIVHGKGRKDRIIPLTASIAHTLTHRNPGWCFPSMYNASKHIHPDTVYRRIKDTVKESTHSLRRKFATDLYRATGGDLRVVQESLGHESLATTQLYISISTQDMRNAIDKLERFHELQARQYR